MHAIKSYSEGFNSDDDEDKKKRKKSEETVKHSQSSSKHERTRGRHSEHDKKSVSSHSERSKRKYPESEKKSAPHTVKSKGQQPEHTQKPVPLHSEKNEVARSRSRSPVQKTLLAKPQEPASQGKQEHSALPALLQAQTAGALVASQIGKVPCLQAHLKLKSIEEKRKKLWGSKKKTASSLNQWEQAKFTDGDSQTQAKFRRLMGMGSTPTQEGGTDADMVQDKHTRTLKNLEHQYESSRYLTHMARGSGLGYGYSSTSDVEK